MGERLDVSGEGDRADIPRLLIIQPFDAMRLDGRMAEAVPSTWRVSGFLTGSGVIDEAQ